MNPYHQRIIVLNPFECAMEDAIYFLCNTDTERIEFTGTFFDIEDLPEVVR